MASIPAIPAPGSLPRGTAAAAPAAPQPVSLPTPSEAPRVGGVTPDASTVQNGQEGLKRVATTPLWSADFSLPSQPLLPPAETPAWNWDVTPQLPARASAYDPVVTSDDELKALLREWKQARLAQMAQTSDGDVEEAEEEEDLDLLELMTWPMRTLSQGIGGAVKDWFGAFQGFSIDVGNAARHVVNEVGHGVQQVAGTVGHGIQQVGGAVGHGIQEAAGQVGHMAQGAANAVGEAASSAWKSITSFRLW